MKQLLRVRMSACLSIVVLSMTALALVVLPPPDSSSAAARAGSLRVTPGGPYVAGQRMTFTGRIGARGVRRVHLQFHMGNVGHPWNDVPGSGARTARDGSFRLSYPAPSMFGIRLRVAAGRLATPAWTFNAQPQDLVLDAPRKVAVGERFAISVDTVRVLPRRPDPVLPAFPGRGLTLQRRVDGDRWQTLETTTVGQRGTGTFSLTAPDQAGTVTYRVRQEDWTRNGNRIGWFPSFPLDVDVVSSAPAGARGSTTAPASRTSSSTFSPASDATTATRTARGGSTTAGKLHRWGPTLWDFAWEWGESLTSRPYRGTDRRGWWLDGSTGSGRAAPRNGQLTLDSQRNWTGLGDRGTTTATLHGNAMTYGRWETKVRLKRLEGAARDYRALIELVPSRTGDYRCGRQNITVANVPVHGSTVGIGVRTPAGRQWTATKQMTIGTAATAFAVEVSRRHITWFVNGRAVGTVRSRAAVPDVPLTLRLTLVGGDSDQEMNHTQLHSDWQRAWSLNRGALVTSGARLRSGTYDETGC